ncbi:MAG: MFS transporter [Thermoleophilia bacterium]
MTGYGALVRHAGAGRLLAALVLAWGSYGPLTLGLFLSVRAATGSAAAAGLAEAANAAGFAVLAAPRGRLIDRRGGTPWLVVITALFAACLLGIVVCAWAGVHAWWPYLVISALVGLTSPPLVAAVRSAWTHVVPQDRLRPAYAVTGVIGDVAFVVGPVLAAVLFTVGRPLPLLACAVLVVAAGVVAAPGVPPAAARPDRAGVPAAMVPLLAASVALGMAMGTVDVATPTAVQAWGHSGWAGPLLGLFAAGSVVAGWWSRRRHWRAPYAPLPGGDQAGAVLALGALTTRWRMDWCCWWPAAATASPTWPFEASTT